MTIEVYCIFSKPNDREMTKYTIFPAFFLSLFFSLLLAKRKTGSHSLLPPAPTKPHDPVVHWALEPAMPLFWALMLSCRLTHITGVRCRNKF